MGIGRWGWVILVVLILCAGLPPLLQSTVQSQDASAINCKDFVDQNEAQRFFIAEGGPTYDPYALDNDNDGIVCEPGPAPTPVSPEHAEYCEGFAEYLSDSEADGATGDRYRQECSDYIEQERGYPRCPSYEGLSYLYFSKLNRIQVWLLSDMQESEYNYLMDMRVGECVAVDVAKSGAWECKPFAFYEREYQRAMFVPISNYYRDQLNERYRAVCLGESTSVWGGSVPVWQLGLGAVIGAGGVYMYTKRRKQPQSSDSDMGSTRYE